MGEVGKGVLIFLIAVQEKILFSLYFFDYFRYSGYLNSWAKYVSFYSEDNLCIKLLIII